VRIGKKTEPTKYRTNHHHSTWCWPGVKSLGAILGALIVPASPLSLLTTRSEKSKEDTAIFFR
jgi:hypothetical protein